MCLGGCGTVLLDVCVLSCGVGPADSPDTKFERHYEEKKTPIAFPYIF